MTIKDAIENLIFELYRMLSVCYRGLSVQHHLEEVKSADILKMLEESKINRDSRLVICN